jgi:hypothetical protein
VLEPELVLEEPLELLDVLLELLEELLELPEELLEELLELLEEDEELLDDELLEPLEWVEVPEPLLLAWVVVLVPLLPVATPLLEEVVVPELPLLELELVPVPPSPVGVLPPQAPRNQIAEANSRLPSLVELIMGVSSLGAQRRIRTSTTLIRPSFVAPFHPDDSQPVSDFYPDPGFLRSVFRFQADSNVRPAAPRLRRIDPVHHAHAPGRPPLLEPSRRRRNTQTETAAPSSSSPAPVGGAAPAGGRAVPRESELHP